MASTDANKTNNRNSVAAHSSFRQWESLLPRWDRSARFNNEDCACVQARCPTKAAPAKPATPPLTAQQKQKAQQVTDALPNFLRRRVKVPTGKLQLVVRPWCARRYGTVFRNLHRGTAGESEENFR
jgi:hypothetical protein